MGGLTCSVARPCIRTCLLDMACNAEQLRWQQHLFRETTLCCGEVLWFWTRLPSWASCMTRPWRLVSITIRVSRRITLALSLTVSSSWTLRNCSREVWLTSDDPSWFLTSCQRPVWINRELKHRRPWATNGNRKLTVPFVGLFLLLVLDWKTLFLMPGDLLLQMRWCQDKSKEKKSTSGCRSRVTDVCA